MWWAMGPGMWGGNWLGGGWWFGGLMMVAFWALVIGGVVWLVRVVSPAGGGAAERSRAKAILEERFARGEISEEEFRRMREELG